MTSALPEVVVAGHLCLDVIPELPGVVPGPGALVEVGDAQLTTGGAVGNVGLALHRLGHPVRLVGAVGDDGFGTLVRERLRSADASLDRYLQVHPGEPTSYSVVLSPPGIDRSFLHCPGVNHCFDPDAVGDDVLRGADFLHFGYPPLMRRVMSDGGQALAGLFRRAKAMGLGTSLDLAMPDALGQGLATDWPAFFGCVLPHVDLFVPSVDETRAVLGLEARPNDDESDLPALASRLMDFGATCVVLKLGERGLYLRSGEAASTKRTQDASAWKNRELIARCFKVQVAGTTGSGDCTIAGLLSAFLNGGSPESALVCATAVGACSVECSGATGGVPTLGSLSRRLAKHWDRYDQRPPTEWVTITDRPGLFAGPDDQPKPSASNSNNPRSTETP